MLMDLVIHLFLVTFSLLAASNFAAAAVNVQKADVENNNFSSLLLLKW